MDDDLKWVAGVAITSMVFLCGTLIAAFRNLAARISNTSGELHGRIDDVKDNYVRRDDLAGHIGRIENQMTEMRTEMRESNAKVIEAIRNAR